MLLVMCTDGEKGSNSPPNPTAISLGTDKTVESYRLSDKSILKGLLMRYCDINTMFGSIGKIDS